MLAINNINVDTPKQQVTIDEFYTEKGKINLNITPTGADLATLLLPKNIELVSSTDNATVPTKATASLKMSILPPKRNRPRMTSHG
ncbi:hypothetical protein PEC18_35430 [Paucibacter sp. O1-1]|nr:hypothetical protein [Paucibacter sp. O1-1]MDA3830959.1 hypothetical protein [Paucibacter sp. O1-1]